MSRCRSLAVGTLAVAAVACGLVAVPVGSAPAGAVGPSLDLHLMWSSGSLGDAGGPIAESSPTVATLDGGGPAVVVGDRAGRVYALHLTDGSQVAGWPVSLGHQIDSTPSAANLNGAALDTVFVGTGNAADPSQGGYQGIGPAGNVVWFSQVAEPPTDPQQAPGVQASLSVGPLQNGQLGVVAGSLDQEEYALDASTGATLPGWPFFSSDSIFSTAALGDLYGTGQTEIVEGSDQTSGFALGQTYGQGGHLRILNGQGGLICHYDTDQTVESSPAIGGFLPGGATGIVMGTGAFFAGASDTNRLLAFNTQCGLQWSAALDGVTGGSPALADVGGNGTMDVVEGTQGNGTGSVWVLDAATGTALWHAPTTGEVIGSPTTADLTGLGYQDLLVPTTLGVDIFDGQSHQQVAVLNGAGDPHGVLGFQNAPLVTVDPNGTVGITVAGYGCPTSQCFGMVEHYEIPGSNGLLAVSNGSWPEFHHDSHLTGDAGGTPAIGAVPACSIPAAATNGYQLVASDGGIFSFSSPFCGSMGGTHLNAPVVAMAQAPAPGATGWSPPTAGSSPSATPASTARWAAAASTGRSWAWPPPRTARATGWSPPTAESSPSVTPASTARSAGLTLNAARSWAWRPPPTATATGWSASDGGVFAFGDARFFGSMGGMHLNQPDRGDRRRHRQPGATGWSAPTAGSSPSATPASSARWAAPPSPARSSGWPPTATVSATAWSPPTAGSSTSARPASTAPWAAIL